MYIVNKLLNFNSFNKKWKERIKINNLITLKKDKRNSKNFNITQEVIKKIKRENKELYKLIKDITPKTLKEYLNYGKIPEDIYKNYLKNTNDYIVDYRDDDNCFADYLNGLVYEYIFISYIKYKYNKTPNKIGEGNIDIERNNNKITNKPDTVIDKKKFEVQVKYTNKYKNITIKKNKLKNMLRKNKELFIFNFYVDFDYSLYFTCVNANKILNKSKIKKVPGFGYKECYIYNLNDNSKHKIV